jgi:predicted deacylase
MLSFSEFNYHFVNVSTSLGADIVALDNGSVIASINPKSHRKSKVIMSGVHGDERGGPLAILKYLQNKKLNTDNYQTIILPLINEDGWGKKDRHHTGIDLNRNFNSSGPSHVRQIINYLSPKEIDLFVDLHEDIDEDGFVYKLSTDSHNFADQVASHIGCPTVVEDNHDQWGDSTEKFIRSLGCFKAVTTEAPGKVSPEDKINWNYKAFEFVAQL